MTEKIIKQPDRSLKKQVLDQLDECDIKPNERLGQHFLTDQDTLNAIVDLVTPGSFVLEVGSGVGQLTESLAAKAARVVGIEIDQRFRPCLERVEVDHPNVEIKYGDALNYDWNQILPKRYQGEHSAIVGNIPYHITEPFMRKLAATHTGEAILMIGKKLADTVTAESEKDPNFSKLTALSQSHFHTNLVTEVGKDKFYPPPRVRSAVVQLLPKSKEEITADQHSFVFQRLFAPDNRNSTVSSVLKDAMVESHDIQKPNLGKSGSKRHARRENKRHLRQLVASYAHGNFADDNKKAPKVDRLHKQKQAMRSIEQLGLPPGVLDQPFDSLNNDQIRQLSATLRFK